MKLCQYCERELDVPGDAASVDCGGDCAQCMADLTDDPDFDHLRPENERTNDSHSH